MRAFIIRPFGKRADANGHEIDFEDVERVLIAPALAVLGYEGLTTQEIARAGNIRMDMFRLLVTADLVVVDLSIHNANVFYELGIRHALRDKRTFLIKCKADENVFDLQTDRYLQYEREDPAGSLDALIRGLRQTRDSTVKDSPVFLLLPDLQVQDRSLLLTVPPDFTEDVERAADRNRLGDLALFADEVRGREWESAGLRVIGRTEFKLLAVEGARLTWNALRELEGEDLEANTSLGTIYQRLGDLTASDQAIRRALANEDAGARARAELRSLLGSNAKARWQAEWTASPADQLRTRALRSPWLDEAAAEYASGFEEDLNHFYSGLNALAMLVVQEDLAAALPDVWAERFDDPDEVQSDRRKRLARISQLSATVDLSIQAARGRLERTQRKDVWANISAADLQLLTVSAPPRVAQAYRVALVGADGFAVDSARKQLALYLGLGVREDNVRAALGAFPDLPAPPALASGTLPTPPRIVLFTGHMIDAPGRGQPRFPADKEAIARQAIRDELAREMTEPGGIMCGVAGGGNGGDVLFHEVCDELGIPSELYLVVPPEQFVVRSVEPAGPAWVERFRKLLDTREHYVLQDSEELPRWLRDKPNYGIWQRSNLWMLHNALSLGGQRLTLLALWDEEPGDGPGGTQDMVDRARAMDANVVICKTRQLFGLDAAA